MMKYIKNTLGYDITLRLKDEKNLGEYRDFTFNCNKFYNDTNSLYHSGVTEISDTDFKLLKENRQFAKCIEKRELCVVDKKEYAEAAGELEQTRLELEVAQEELKKLKSENKAAEAAKLRESNTQLLKENDNLKARLEAFEKKADKTSKAN